MPSELISARAACRELATIGLAREQARLVLACGLAGRPRVLGDALGYDQRSVTDLVAQPLLAVLATDVPHAPGTVLVLRQARGVNPRSPWHPGTVASTPLRLGRSIRVWLDIRGRHGDPMPCLVTVAGFVAGGFDIVGADCRDGMTHLRLASPGAWFDDFRGRRLEPVRGREWAWWPRQPRDEHFTEINRRTGVRQRPATREGDRP